MVKKNPFTRAVGERTIKPSGPTMFMNCWKEGIAQWQAQHS